MVVKAKPLLAQAVIGFVTAPLALAFGPQSLGFSIAATGLAFASGVSLGVFVMIQVVDSMTADLDPNKEA